MKIATILRRFLALIPALVLLSCADFMNQKRDGGAVVPQEKKQTRGRNPFPDGFDPNQGAFSEEKMIANIGLNVIAPRVARLRIESELFLSDIDILVGRMKSGRSVHNELLLAKASWKKVMLSFHFLEGIPVGPLEDKGLGLRDQMYSWPFVNTCGVDHEVVSVGEGSLVSVPALFTVKGLLAMEYLLFEDELGTECVVRNPKNARVVEWTKKAISEKFSDRMLYLRRLADDFLGRAKQLEDAWSPQSGNFTKSMIDGSRYSQLSDATTALSHALFSIEVLKDKRLGKPLGLHKDCLNPNGKCVEDIEHKWSGISFEAIEAQLDGVEAAFFGRSEVKDGFGFDDFLKTMGRSDVADRMQVLFTAFQNQYRLLTPQGTLEEQILAMDVAQCKLTLAGEGAVPVCGLFRDVRQISNKLKSEFLTALSLRAPPSTQGDND